MAGLGDVAAASFLASRVAPAAAFWVALAGGVALARTGQRAGLRLGYGTSMAAMLETLAIMGPARLNGPLTQALSAPLLGHLEGRGRSAKTQMLACAAIRFVHGLAISAFGIWVILGVDAYTGSYDAAARRIPFAPLGETAALAVSLGGLLGWTVFASTIQVLVYRRGLLRWPDEKRSDHARAAAVAPDDPCAVEAVASDGRFDPRALTVAATIAFALLLTSLRWEMLAAVAAWLTIAWAASRGDRGPVKLGLVLAAALALGALSASLIAGLGVDVALRRAVRAALLVLVATHLRAAASANGLREVARRALGRLSRVPSLREGAAVFDSLDSERRLRSSGRALAECLRGVHRRPAPVLDAVLGWVAAEGRRPGTPGSRVPLALRAGPLDALLVAAAAVPAVLLFTG